MTIESTNLVPGDIVDFGNKEIIPADMVLIDSQELIVDGSILFREYFDIALDHEDRQEKIYESKNVAFLGYKVKSGKGVGLVFSTGDRTAVGRLIKLKDVEIIHKVENLQKNTSNSGAVSK